MPEVIICRSTCGHSHDSLNGPTGCCSMHGPYFYFCSTCHTAIDRASDLDPTNEGGRS